MVVAFVFWVLMFAWVGCVVRLVYVVVGLVFIVVNWLRLLRGRSLLWVFIDGLLHDFVCCLLRLLSVVACLGSLIVVIVSCGVLVITGLVLVVG